LADVKISGLPASTTPLAGTEVLPIVQGGQTRQVSVANLTAGRAVSATDLTLTGVATVPAGTAAAPSITTTGDTNTGVFFPAADTIAFTEGGAESMRIHSSGGVSIGNTTDPGATNLSVTGSASIQSLTVGKGGGTVITNTVVGRFALASNLVGTDNTAVGNFSQNPSTGFLNTSVGSGSLRFNTTGGGNTAMGHLGLYSTTTGSYNTSIGYNAGNTNTTGNNNTYLGSTAVGSANNNTNETVIGYNAVGLGSNTTVIGNSSTTATKLFGSVTATGLIYPQQAPTATAPAYVIGAIYFDTTLNKLRVGGATGWETVTSV
jgi:hypothetical protein